MIKLSEEVIDFFKRQSFIIVVTRDAKGSLHCSCKGIVKINRDGKVYLLDLYKKRTFENLKNDKNISIIAVDEHKFIGYCLKGRAQIISAQDFDQELNLAWEESITKRITQRVIRNLKQESGHSSHPEASFPRPQYLILMDINEVVDLTPHHLK